VPEKGAMLNTIAAFDARSVRFGRELPPKPDSNLIFREKICWKSSGFMGPQLAGPFLSLFQKASGCIAYVAACETCQLLTLKDQVSFKYKQTYIHIRVKRGVHQTLPHPHQKDFNLCCRSP
jgi:hypothetical protein